MRKCGVLFLVLCSLFLCGCTGKTEKPTESESIPLIFESSESESEEEETGGKNSAWEAYATPVDLAIQTEDGTMQFDSVFHDLFHIVLTFHFIPNQPVWEPGSKVTADMAKKLRELAQFSLRRGEGTETPEPEYTQKKENFEAKVRADGSVGGVVMIRCYTFVPIAENDMVVCFRGNSTDVQLSPDQVYEIPLAPDFDHLEISLENAKLDPAIEVTRATLSPFSYTVYGRFPSEKDMNENARNKELNKIAKNFQVCLKDHEVHNHLAMGETRVQGVPDEKGFFQITIRFDRPLDLKNVDGILLESGVLLPPVEEQ